MKVNLFSLINFVSLLTSLSVCYGQIPQLGSSTSFAVFTAAGAINSTGPTTLTGDLGTDAGACNGFPPGILNGGQYVENSVSALASEDLLSAYSSFSSITCGSVIGTSLGNGQTLTPNVYCLGAASTLNGNLTLDAQGNPNAIFIFKIDGAFVTGGSSNIILANSASPCNIYWQINGQFTLDEFSIFSGTVIANGAVNLLDNSSIQGRALSVAGAVTLISSVVDNICALALPVKLVSFSGKCKDNSVQLKWTTANEINNNYFSIERSTDTRFWENIGKVEGSGNSTAMLNYQFIDDRPMTLSPYYRFKQVDFDGKYSFSNVINLRNCGDLGAEIETFPNPTRGKVNITYKDGSDKFISATVFNASGEKIYHTINQESAIDLTNQNNGIYLLHINMLSGLTIKKITIGR